MPTPLSDVELLARLIGFDSAEGRGFPGIADFCCEYAEDGGARVERQASPDGAKCNLILRFGPEPKGREGLVLSGHLDTVPAGEGWSTDPLELIDRAGRLYGRGACDMKGFVALALNVGFEASELNAPLVLLFTYDEETGTVGSRHFAEQYSAPDSLPVSTIVGEPTSLRVVRMHKGFMAVTVTLFGKSAHSGYPHLGRNAVEAAGRVIAAMRGLRLELEKEGGPNEEHFPEVPYVPLNVAAIRGGVAANVVPERCELDLSFRVLPGMEPSMVLDRLRAKVEAAAGPDRFEFESHGECPPMLLATDAPIHRALCDLVGQETGESASYATDAGWLDQAGFECAIWGPGSIEVAHKPDEFMPKVELVEGRRLLAQLVGRFCK